MPKLPKPLKGTIIEDAFENLEGIGKETVDQTKKAGPQIAKSAASQVMGRYQQANQKQPVKITSAPTPPTDQDIVNRFYGADQQNLIPDTNLVQEKQKKQVEEQKRLSTMRQKLRQMFEKKPEQREPSVREKDEMEKEKKKEMIKQQAKKQPKPLQPSKGRPKGMAALNPLAWKKYRAARGAEVKGGSPSA